MENFDATSPGAVQVQGEKHGQVIETSGDKDYILMDDRLESVDNGRGLAGL